MKQIWHNLPIEIVYYHILPKCDIDTRVALHVIPQKLELERYSKINECLTKPICKIYFKYNLHCFIRKNIKEKILTLSYTKYKCFRKCEAWVYTLENESKGCIEMYSMTDETNKYIKV